VWQEKGKGQRMQRQVRALEKKAKNGQELTGKDYSRLNKSAGYVTKYGLEDDIEAESDRRRDDRFDRRDH